jgi:hypothetical protein
MPLEAAMTDLEIIKGARELISDPERWGQGWYAHDKKGDWADFASDSACRWCAMGAIRKQANSGDDRDCLHLYRLLSGNFSLNRFNDTHTHAEVIALFDAAIARLEGGAQ